MRISYTKYENAPMATACSFLGNVVGGLMAGSGLVAVFSKEFGMGLVLIVVGIGLIAGATVLSEKMEESAAFRKWWKQVKTAKLEPEIAKSVDVAVQIYKKNPRKQTLSKIESLNPAAARYIRRNIR